MKRSNFLFLMAWPVILLTGCREDAHSPTLDVLGSYFPSWMVCVILGITATLITRQLLIGFKLDTYVKPAVLFYPCLAVVYTLATWVLIFRN